MQNSNRILAADLNPVYYTFEVHFKSFHAIRTSPSTDYQTAVFNFMWFDGMLSVSDGIYDIASFIKSYNYPSPIRDTCRRTHKASLCV